MQLLSRAVTVALGLALAAGPALAQDPIAARKAAMKKNGGAMAQLVKMSKGEEPYDSAKAKAAAETIAEDLQGLDALFPPGSDKGDTKATAKVWEDMAGFKVALTRAQDAARTAAPLVAKDLDGLKAGMGAIGQACSGCHNTYRRSS